MIRRWKINWNNGFHWWFYSGVVGTLGLWGALCLMIFQKDPQWFTPFDHGELFLYGAGFTAPSLYVLQKERKITQFPCRGFLTALSFLLILIAAFFFAGATLASLAQPIPDLILPVRALRYGGFAFFAVCMVIGFAVIVLEEKRIERDFDATKDQGVKEIEKRWDEEQRSSP